MSTNASRARARRERLGPDAIRAENREAAKRYRARRKARFDRLLAVLDGAMEARR